MSTLWFDRLHVVYKIQRKPQKILCKTTALGLIKLIDCVYHFTVFWYSDRVYVLAMPFDDLPDDEQLNDERTI